MLALKMISPVPEKWIKQVGRSYNQRITEYLGWKGLKDLRIIELLGLGWAELGWIVLRWAGLGWVGLSWVELCWAGLGWAALS